MGNSNSIPNLATAKQRFTLEELHSYYQQEGLNFNSDNRHSLRNKNENQPIQSRLTDAYLHETYQDHQQQQVLPSLPPIAHIKVLPDFNPDGARLRCTTNGNILNSGGTISGRKDQQHQQQLDLPLKESFVKSSSPQQVQINRQRSLEPPSSGQIIRNKSFEQLNLKDFNRRNYISLSTKIDSSSVNQQRNNNSNSKNQQHENFLNQRNDDNEINRNSNNKLNLFSSSGKTNIVKCKKKKSAPLPPQPRNSENLITTSTNNRNNHLINSYDKGIQKQQPLNQNIELGHQKKLRLFKTNAETKKSLPLSSATPQHHNNNSRGNRDDNSGLTGLNGNDKKNFKTGINYKDSRVKLFPTPIIFRREKSFDASLLLNHRKQYNNNSNDKIDLKHNYNNNLKLQQDNIDLSKMKNVRQNHERLPHIKKSHLETKINNKISQPSAQIFQNNFKKELEEATKNRRNSISAIDVTSINPLNYDNKDLKTPKININQNDKDLSNNRKLLNRIIPKNEEKICNISNKDNQNISQSQLISRKFYFGMGSNKKYDDIKDEPIIDLNDKLSGSSLSDRAIDNHILSQQLINKNQIDFMDAFGKDFINNKELNSLSSESDDISTTDILNNNHVSPQLYQIPKNCTINTIDDDTGDIQLNVRPTLPRRQLEIPRFSPAAAWRMLNDEQKNLLTNLSNNRKLNTLNSSTETLSIKSLDLTKQQPVIEERIQRIFREPPIIYSDNKSGDSGISGDDAGLQLDGGTDSPGINFVTDSQDNNNKNNNNMHELLGATNSPNSKNCIGNFLIPWTPQQDLEDDDDDDDDLSSSDGNNIGKLLNDDPEAIRGHVFSVSLPREGHHQPTTFGDKDKFGFSSLQKLKRTVSGAFLAGSNCTSTNNTTQIINSNNFTSLQNDAQQTGTRISNYCSDNWVLSRSALNSIENSQISSSNNKDNSQQHSTAKPLNHHDSNLNCLSSVNNGNELLNEDNPNFKGSPIITGTSKIQSSSLNYVTTGRHMMYLPNRIKDNNNNYHNEIQSTHNSENIIKNNKKSINLPNKSTSKLDNNHSNKKEILRENLQDSKPAFKDKKSGIMNRSKNSSNHRFTFQSTVRQIERRRISERLSKEAEEKEALRKSELEAMTRVEEEFQRKRAREKATICHQLRLYSMEENQCNSLPIDLPLYNDESTDLRNDLLLQKLPIINRNKKINKFNNKNNNNHRNYRAEPDGAVSNSPPSSPSYSQNTNKMNNINGNYYDDEYFNISDDSKGLQNSNQRQRKNSINLNCFQKTGYIDESNIPNRSPIQRYNNKTKLLNSEKNCERLTNNKNIPYNDEFNSDSDISEKNDIRLKYRKYSHK